MSNSFEKFEKAVHDIRIAARFNELAQLSDGWLDGGGEKFDTDELNWLKVVVLDVFNDMVLVPFIYPTPEGSVLLEWPYLYGMPSLDVDIINKTGRWHSIYTIPDELDFDVDLSKKETWSRVVKEIEFAFFSSSGFSKLTGFNPQ